MKRILLGFLGLLSFVGAVEAQQLPYFTQYREHHTLINPAIINSDRAAFSYMPTRKANISYRSQWTKLADAPRTFSGQYEHILEDLNMAFGGAIVRDQTGPLSSTAVNLRYAYQAYFSDDAFVSMGLSAGFGQFRFRGDQGIFYDPGDNVGFTNNQRMLTEFNAGVFYQQEMRNYDILYGGLSVPQVATADLGGSGEAGDDFRFRRVPHFYGEVGYYKYLGDGVGDRSMFIEPSAWFKYAANVPFQTDLNLRYQVADLFWVGGGMSISMLDKLRRDNAHFEAGVTMTDNYYNSGRSLKIGVGYDTNITQNGAYLGPAIEINVSYAWE